VERNTVCYAEKKSRYSGYTIMLSSFLKKICKQIQEEWMSFLALHVQRRDRDRKDEKR